jgi:hypothetical protein
MNKEREWPFDQPPNCAVFTVRTILEEDAPILYVSHDADDHGWQFLGKERARTKNARIVSFQEIVELDDSLLALGNLPPGAHAWRNTREAAWNIER